MENDEPLQATPGAVLTALDENLMDLLVAVQEGGVTVSCNKARENASLIGMAASLNLISTKVTRNVFGREWRLTVAGLLLLSEVELEDVA